MKEFDPLEIHPYAAKDMLYGFNEIDEEEVPVFLRNLADYFEENDNHSLLGIRFQHDYPDDTNDPVRVRVEYYVSA